MEQLLWIACCEEAIKLLLYVARVDPWMIWNSVERELEEQRLILQDVCSLFFEIPFLLIDHSVLLENRRLYCKNSVYCSVWEVCHPLFQICPRYQQKLLDKEISVISGIVIISVISGIVIISVIPGIVISCPYLALNISVFDTHKSSCSWKSGRRIPTGRYIK